MEPFDIESMGLLAAGAYIQPILDRYKLLEEVEDSYFESGLHKDLLETSIDLTRGSLISLIDKLEITLISDFASYLADCRSSMRTMMWLGFACSFLLITYFVGSIIVFRRKIFSFFYKLFFVRKADVAAAYLHLIGMDSFWQLLLSDQWQCFR